VAADDGVTYSISVDGTRYVTAITVDDFTCERATSRPGFCREMFQVIEDVPGQTSYSPLPYAQGDIREDMWLKEGVVHGQY
jgi:hypothetical protein